jgi:DnaJ like chaperone protein
MLAWLSQCDGDIDERERALLEEVAGSFLLKEEQVSAFFKIARNNNVGDLTLAGHNLRYKILPEHRGVVFELAIAMAMADGVFSVGENHVIRFLADVLLRSESEMDDSFQRVTGRPLPTPSDVSSAKWWNENEKRRKEASSKKAKSQRTKSQSGAKSQGSYRPPPRRSQAPARLEALKQLGLDETANLEEIKAAYKRLARVHHPDRFHGLDEEIVKAATVSFQKIRGAYESLTR